MPLAFSERNQLQKMLILMVTCSKRFVNSEKVQKAGGTTLEIYKCSMRSVGLVKR
jgi:hypothetical protein